MSHPRGQEIVGLRDVTRTFPACVTYRRRHDNPLIGFVEGFAFIAGIGDVSYIKRVAPNAKLSLFTSFAFYGPRVHEQADWVVNLLLNDRDTRRAVIVLPNMDEVLEDRPCTTSLQYQITNMVELHVTVNMRSSDAVWGLPYDLTQFNLFSTMIARCVGCDLVDITLMIGNAHIYTAIGERVVDAAWVPGKVFTPWSFEVPFDGITTEAWRTWARYEIKNVTHSELVSDWKFKEEK